MPIVDHPAFTIYRGQRKYDDEQPLNKNTPNLDFQRPIDDPAPYIVVVQGPRHVGKSLLIESLNFNIDGNYRGRTFFPTFFSTLQVPNKPGIRLQFVECPDDIHGMIDAAKYADVVILMVDASYGFGQETFEFRNLLQIHGFPKVIGVLTHLDKVGLDELSKVKQRVADHFCTEIYEGAKLFSLTGLEYGLYKMHEIGDLVEMLSDSQFLPLSWRAEHPYVLVDQFDYCCFDDFEDVTPERVHGDKQFNRNLRLYGYLRGCNIKKGAKVHIAGAGDFFLADVTEAYDPYPVNSAFGNFNHLVKKSTGTYLMLVVVDVPPEIVENFDPCRPILVGGILPEEENSGYMQVKLKRHSWRTDLLMTGAPITVSAGWRRYQTTAIYAMENKNGQHQLLNYTPEHKECLAVFWGPLAPPKTRIVAVMNYVDCLKNKEAFRIMAKGVVLDNKPPAQILLKVEKILTVVDTRGKTARIKFAPKFKIDGCRFIGASIQTKSGVRGKIHKVARYVSECVFDENVHMGDTFLFPVSAKLVLPALFKQLNLLFKPFQIGIDDSNEATIAAVDAAITAVDDAAAAAATATITATAAANLATAVEDELAVSYEEVAPRWRKLDPRRGVVILEGKPSLVTLPNPLETAYSSVQWKPVERRKFSDCEVREIFGEKAKKVQICGEVKEKRSLDRPGEEAAVIKEVLSNDRTFELFLRRYGGKRVLLRQY